MIIYYIQLCIYIIPHCRYLSLCHYKLLIFAFVFVFIGNRAFSWLYCLFMVIVGMYISLASLGFHEKMATVSQCHSDLRIPPSQSTKLHVCSHNHPYHI